jgi:tartrate dehydrogenase/decarboxylase/D-malate dehydrogenase
MSKPHRIAVIPGDGIGTEVVPEGLRVLDAAASAFNLDLTYEHFDYASADYYTRHGKMLPDGWFDQLNQFDSIFFGAVGWPDVVPDHISLWGSLLQFRRHFDQYVSLRRSSSCPACPAPCPAGTRATSTSTSCAKTPKANTPASAGKSSKAPTAKPWSRKRS